MIYTSPDVYQFISDQTNDPIVERKICRLSWARFAVYQSDLEFYKKMSNQFWENILVPTPTLCPEERCRRRLSRQNMRKLYRRTCDATGEKLISNISPNKSYTVYDQSYRWSDARDFRTYGKDIDFNRPFFEQFWELLDVVPQPNLTTNHLLDENSEYTNFAGNNKNCYLIFHADMNKDCLFGVWVKKCKNVIDVIHTHSCENMYECIDCRNSYGCQYAENCEDCTSSYFIKNCVGCSFCFWCVNQINKQYCFFNTQLSKEEYTKKIASLPLWSRKQIHHIKQKFEKFSHGFPIPGTYIYQSEKSHGDLIFRSENVQHSFDIQESKSMKYCHRIYNGTNRDCYDVNEYGMQIEKVCEWLAIGINAQDILYGVYVNEEVSRVSYSMHVHHSHDIFWSIWATHTEYCILNKQYSKHEYEQLRDKLINHMKETWERWEFFPSEYSPFWYNETVAQEYFPLHVDQKKETAQDTTQTWPHFQIQETDEWNQIKNKKLSLQREFTSYDPVIPSHVDTLSAKEIPDNIRQVEESILKKIFICSESWRPFRIIKQELDAYIKNHIPLPIYHPDIRHAMRREKRSARHLYMWTCHKTQKKIISTSSPDSSATILDQDIYMQEVYW